MKQFFDKYKFPIYVIGALIAATVLTFLLLYYSADSTVSVPKADNLSNRSNASVNQAIQSKDSADDFANQAEALEQSRQEAVQKARKSRDDFQTKKQKFQKEVKNHEEIKNTPVVISTDNLDERERRLRSDLRDLYPERK